MLSTNSTGVKQPVAPQFQSTTCSPSGAGSRPANDFCHTPDWLLSQWETMLRTRRAEEAIAGMVERGEAGCPCHLCIGQEAVAAGVCAALTPQDSIWGGHGSQGH